MGLLALAVLAASTENLKAQTGGSGQTSYLSIGPELGLPVGQMNDRYNSSFGASVQADLFLSDELFFTVNLGYGNFFLKSKVAPGRKDLQLMPIKIGIKVFPTDNLYLQGSIGASFLLNKTDAGYNKRSAFVYAPQIGYQFNAGKSDMIDAGINFQGNTKFITNGSTNNLFGIRLAYGFGL